MAFPLSSPGRKSESISEILSWFNGIPCCWRLTEKLFQLFRHDCTSNLSAHFPSSYIERTIPQCGTQTLASRSTSLRNFVALPVVSLHTTNFSFSVTPPPERFPQMNPFNWETYRTHVPTSSNQENFFFCSAHRLKALSHEPVGSGVQPNTRKTARKSNNTKNTLTE